MLFAYDIDAETAAPVRNDYREHVRPFSGATVGILVRQRIEEMISSTVAEEFDRTARKTRRSNPEIPRDLLVDYLALTFVCVTTWWLDSE